MAKALEVIPGVEFGFQQPIQMRFNELMTGAKQDVAVKIFGEAIDRSINSMVTDFLQIRFGGSSIFVVNFADIFIVIGVFGLVVSTKASKSGRTPK